MNILFLSSSMLILKKQQHFIPVFQCFHGTSCIRPQVKTYKLLFYLVDLQFIPVFCFDIWVPVQNCLVSLSDSPKSWLTGRAVWASMLLCRFCYKQKGRKEKHCIFFLETNTFIIKIKKNTDLSQAVGTFNSSSLFKVTHQSFIGTEEGEEGWVDVPICKQVVQLNQL